MREVWAQSRHLSVSISQFDLTKQPFSQVQPKPREHGRGQAFETDKRVRFMVVGSSSLRGQRADAKEPGRRTAKLCAAAFGLDSARGVYAATKVDKGPKWTIVGAGAVWV